MTRKYQAVLLNLDGSYQLQEIDGHKNILVRDEKTEYTYEEVIEIADKAVYTKRAIYGWNIGYAESGQPKEIFIGGYETTSSKQSVHQWIDRVYDKDDRQVSLF